ncbi:MAG: efflux RND transporter periplasmic adaptor subunit [Phycisphaerae bacterium]|nr:efflux RND transporter periplasmic adaptor subunit [Phycisphaerae bacterium]
MARRIILSVVLVTVVLAVGVGGHGLLLALKAKPEAIKPDSPVLTVNAIKLEPVTVVAPVEGFGTARADRLAVIGSQVAGLVVELGEGLHDGTSFKEGALLVRIDAREYQAHLQRARSQLAADQAALEQIDIEEENLKRMIGTSTSELEVAQREYSRIRDLLEAGTSSVRELDAARVVLKRARRGLQELERQLAVVPKLREQQRATCELRRAEVTLTELNVERCEIVAPFSGRVEQIRVEAGEQVVPGQQLLTLLDPDLIEVPLELAVSLRERVRAGTPARLMLESNPGAIWTGRVARLSPSADEMTRTFSLYIEVSNKEQSEPLMPGMFVQARIDGPTLTDVLLVPRAAVRRQRVFICEDNRAYAREVQIDQHLYERTVISGLSPGQVVITSNLDALYDGAPVNPIVESSPSAPSSAPAR